MARPVAACEDAGEGAPQRASAPVVPPVARGLNRVQAAAYVGVSPNTFSKMIADGLMPKPKRYGARLIWDRHALDLHFDALGGDDSDSTNSWDRVL